MGKKLTFFLISVLLLLLGMFVVRQDSLPGWDAPKELPANYQRRIRQEILQVGALLETAPSDINAQETALMAAGFAILDTDAVYPAYLSDPGSLTAFWASVCAGKEASLSVLRVTDDQALRHLFFLHRDGETTFFTTDIRMGEQAPYVLESEVRPVYDMELADWGIFYYRLFPAGDPHYIDYNQIRLRSPDRALYDLNRKYVLPVGYQMVNLFLCDWQEGSWGSLSFHDLLESLYLRDTGETLDWEPYPRDNHGWVMIPAPIFEHAILPYFQISPEDFRSLCRYDESEDCYPWRPIHGDNLTTWKYPMCEPEVMGYTENRDGTITLDVQVYSPELKTDRLFCHQLTVRPLDGERFQYVANKVTYVSDRGLPPNMPRFALDEG